METSKKGGKSTSINDSIPPNSLFPTPGWQGDPCIHITGSLGVRDLKPSRESWRRDWFVHDYFYVWPFSVSTAQIQVVTIKICSFFSISVSVGNPVPQTLNTPAVHAYKTFAPDKLYAYGEVIWSLELKSLLKRFLREIMLTLMDAS